MNKEAIYSSPMVDGLKQEISIEEFERIEKRMLLAVRIDEAIKTRGLKRKDFAKALGKTPSEISKWLSGTHNFTSDTLFDIERVLNIKLMELDNKTQYTIKTYVYKATAQSAQEPNGLWENIIYNKG